MFEGYTCLELMRKGKVVHRVEHKNTITPWVKNAMNKGNFNFMMTPEKILPLKQWYGGCLLTDKDNDPTISMIAHDSNVIAQASKNAYTGTNLRRGSFNSNESRDVTGGYRFVWDWTTSQGNGTIKSVCLTREALGATDITEDFSTPDASCMEYISSRYTRSASFYGPFILDYDREKLFTVRYDGTTGAEKIIINEYLINTYRYHLTGKLGDMISLIASHEISQAIASFNENTTSVSYTGDYFYIFRVTNGGSTMDEYKIAVADWTCVKTSHSYNGVSLFRHAGQGNYLLKDIIPVVNGYAYAYGYENQKIYKLNLANDADVVAYDNPIANVNTQLEWNGPGVLLPNGDFYKFSTVYGDGVNNATYFHDGKFYRVLGNSVNGSDWGEGRPNLHSSSYGTVISTSTSDDTSPNGQGWEILAFYPYVSTVNNLETAVTKASDLTMKLTYEVKRAVA
jgi:hypothetical protein